MKLSKFSSMTLAGTGAVTFLALVGGIVNAQAQGGRGARGPGTPMFTAVDTNADGSVSQAELKAAFDAWFTAADKTKSGAVMQWQLQAAMTPVFNKATPETVQAMIAALPPDAAAKPVRAHKILVFGKAVGFVHSSIPLAAVTVEELGKKGNLWTTDISYDPSVFTAANLKQYDAIFLDSTTGCFLDDPNDKAVTAARRKAFMDFVRGGKGIAGIHAASDAYHTDCSKPGGAGGSANPVTASLMIMEKADTNGDQKLSRQEMDAFANSLFDKLDTAKAGTLSKDDFVSRFNAAYAPPPPARGPAPAARGRGAAAAEAPQVAGGQMPPGTVEDWPEFNKLIGGFFKFHWSNQLITVKIDDPKSPLTAMFHGQEFQITDETYTFAQDSFSRTNVHVLTSVDYDKMSATDKAKEPAATRRTDGDYPLSYIRKEGKGRMFYEAHGHGEEIYAITPMLEHVRAGIQYALGDLKADDSPSKK